MVDKLTTIIKTLVYVVMLAIFFGCGEDTGIAGGSNGCPVSTPIRVSLGYCVAAAPTPTPTSTPTATPSPSPTPTHTPTITPSPTSIPTPIPRGHHDHGRHGR